MDFLMDFGLFRLFHQWKVQKQLVPYNSSILFSKSVERRGSQRDVVYLGWPMAPAYMSPNAGGEGGIAGSQPMSSIWALCAQLYSVQLYTWSPNKLWRYNSIFDLWLSFSMRCPVKSVLYHALSCPASPVKCPVLSSQSSKCHVLSSQPSKMPCPFQPVQ